MNADNVTIDNIQISYRDGSGGMLQNSVINYSSPIFLTGTSVTTPAAPTISGNTINATATAIDVRGTASPTVNGNSIVSNTRGLLYNGTGGGTASGNTISFVPNGGSSRIAIDVDGGASPTIDGNILSDDPNRTDTLIDLSNINSQSTAAVTNNDVCITGNDTAYLLAFPFFADSSTATLSGNIESCDSVLGIPIASSTVSENTTLVAVNNVSRLVPQGLTLSNGSILTVSSGLTLSSGGNFDRTFTIDGTFDADNVVFDRVVLSFRDGSNGLVQNSSLSGATPISLSGNSVTDPAAATFIGNTVDATSHGFSVRGNAIPTITANTITSNFRGMLFADNSAGTASGNTIGFLSNGGSSRIGIEVAGNASPVLDQNNLTDDPNRNDTAIDLAGITGTSAVAVNTNSICTSGGDQAFNLSFGFFEVGSPATISGNLLVCDPAASIPVLTGTFNNAAQLKAVNGITNFIVSSIIVANGASFTIPAGITVSSGGNFDRTITIDGTFAADGAVFQRVQLSYRAGSSGLVQNSGFIGTRVISLSGTSVTNPAAPTFVGNTIDATSEGFYIQGTAIPTITGNSITTNSRGLYYFQNSGGTASGNTIGFLIDSGSSRIAIDVDDNASPVLDQNTLTDDPNRNDTAVDISNITGASAVAVTNNNICTTSGDQAFNLGFGFFENGTAANISGNNLVCDPAASIPVLTGSFSGTGTLGAVNGIGSFVVSSITIANGGSLTIPAGISVSSGGNFDRTVTIDGTFAANGAIFDRVQLSYRAGSSGLVQNSTFNGTQVISLAGTSVTNPISPSFVGNTINATTYGFFIRGTAAPIISGNTITTNSRGLYYFENSGGTASGNSIGFLIDSGSSRVAIDVDDNASPVLDQNTLTDDPNRNDTAVDISNITGASAVAVTNNSICTTGGDQAFNLGFGFFESGATATISGNNFVCDPAASIPVLSGTFSGAGTLAAVNGISTFIVSNVTVSSGASLTIPSGITVSSGGNFNRTITVDGTFDVDGVVFDRVELNYRSGSDGLVQNSTLTGGTAVTLSGTSVTNPASPSFVGNTINATTYGFWIRGTAVPTITGNTITANSRGLFYTDDSGGTASGNTIGFMIDAGSSRIGIDVDNNASPALDQNTLNDDPNRNDTAVDISDISGTSAVALTNNSICTTGGDLAIRLSLALFETGATASVNGNTFVCDPVTAIPILSGTFNGTSQIGAVNGISTYRLSSLTISGGSTLTIPTGISLNSDGNFTRTITIDGSLNADGANFRNLSLNFRAGSVGTLQNSSFLSTVNGTGLSITDAAVSLSGNTFQNFFTLATLSGSADLSADNNVFFNNSTVFSVSSSDVLVTPSNNTYDSNTLSYSFSTADNLFSAMPDLFNGEQFIGLVTQNRIGMPPTINVSGTLRTAPVPYALASSATVSQGVNLIVEPGAVLQFNPSRTMTVDGELIAAGTATQPVVFTVANPKSGNRWGGLIINNKSASATTILNNCIIEFSGFSGRGALRLDNVATPVQNCVIRDNSQHGVELINGSTSDVSNNAILQNLSHGILTNTGADPVVSNNSIFGNGLKGLQNNDPSIIVQAIDNYWGDDSGPRDDPADTRCNTSSNPGGAGDEVSDCVSYDPWIRLGPSIAGTVTGVAGGNQTGTVGTILPIPVEVEVLSTLGNPLSGIEVIFSVAQGDATIVEAMPVVTDVNGHASATVQLGNTVGTILIAATARDVNSPLASFVGEANAPCLFNMTAVALTTNMPLEAPVISELDSSPGSFIFGWTPVPGAQSYDIYRSERSGGAFDLLDSTTELQYEDRTILPGNYYGYRIQAVNGSDRSEFSNVLQINPEPVGPEFVITSATWAPGQRTLTVKGKDAPANETVYIYGGSAELLGQTRADGNGKWTFNRQNIERICWVRVDIAGVSMQAEVKGGGKACARVVSR
ncbi:MAG: right-handed parallel beta-helix repeat-containing protein [Gammaproteobacteria bacterium]